MKTKAFTLIEILIATIIFMSVVVVAVAAFAMVRRSNEISSDISKTEECSRQIENFTGSVFRSASVGSPRIMAVVKNSGGDVLRDLSKVSNNQLDAIGFASFEEVPEGGKVALTIIFKNIASDIKKIGYYYVSSNVNSSDIADMMNITDLTSFNDKDTDPQRIHSSGCVPLRVDEASVGFLGDYQNPFTLKLSYPYAGAPASQIGSPIFVLTINDLIYSSYSAQDKDDKSISKLFVEVTNNIKPI